MPNQPVDGDSAQLLPELLNQMVALGKMAEQLMQALGGNGHRAEAARDIIEAYAREKEVKE